jgi:hypothetical protein
MTRQVTALLCVVLVTLALVSCGAASTGSSGARATNTSGQAQATATPPTTTAPSTPQPVTGTVLGGPVATYEAIFGPPDSTSNTTSTYYISARVTVSGVSNKYAVLVTVRGDAGTGGKRAGFLHLTPLGGSNQWDSATGEAIAKVFLPRDAIFQHDLQHVPNFGTEHVYQSADLALSFPSSAFADLQTGKAVSPGTFYYSCGNQNEPAGGCTLALGQ